MQAKTIRFLSITFFVTLLLWGIYTFLVYIGVPIHDAVLLTDAGEQTVTGACGGQDVTSISGYVCRGSMAFFPFLLHTFGRAAPFLWYAVISLLLYGGYVGYQYLQMGDWKLRITWKPWKVFLLGMMCMWLMFSVLSFSSQNGQAVRTYVQPTKETYSVSEQGLLALQADYQKLLQRGCLAYKGEAQGGAQVYNLRTWCVQASFVTRVVPQVLFVALLLFEFLVIGQFVLSLLGIHIRRVILEALLSVTVGSIVWIIVLWSAAVIGVYTQTLGWALALALPAIAYQQVIYWAKKFFFHEWEAEYNWYDPLVLLGWFLLSYIALNFLTVVRPFPIGWDDLGSYLNRPRLLVSYGHFIHSMAPFEWGYLTSLGFLLFGYDSIFGATASMMVNWAAGLLAIFGVMGFAKIFLGKRAGFVSSTLYYSLPLVGHFSFADMKIDNAVFFYGAISTLCVFLALFPEETASTEEVQSEEGSSLTPSSAFPPAWKLLILAGAASGIAFATKSTGIMVTMALMAILMGALFHWSAFFGAVVLAFMLFTWQGGFNIADIMARVGGQAPGEAITTYFFLGGILLGGVGVAVAFYFARKRMMSSLLLVVSFITGFAMVTFPWIEHNNILNNTYIPRLELGAPNTLSPQMLIHEPYNPNAPKQVRTLPPDLKINKEDPTCKPTGAKEELDRYWGFSKGWSHYFTLPWRSVMNIDAVGYYVTTLPALLLFPLLLLLPAFWKRQYRWLRWLFASTFFILLQWMFLANGIPWYGIGVFLGLALGLEVMVARAPDKPGRIASAILMFLSILIAFGMRIWQFESQRNILEYSFGKISADVLEEITIPHYNDIRDVVVDRARQYPDRPYMYRIGTFIPYFIPKNLEIIGISDHQLDVFNCLFQERNPDLLIRRLKALGFNSIIFDTNTDTIEQDPNGSLHKKVKLFTDFVNANPGVVQVLINDNTAGVAFMILP
jgi:hypothetical protein